MEGFREGYEYFIKSAGSVSGAFAGNSYVDGISEAIKTLTDDLNGFKGFKTDIGKLKGDVAEFWHADTFNIDAAVKGSKNRAHVLRSHGLASVDIRLNSGEKYGSKYDATAQKTAAEQAKSYWERYKKYVADQKSRGGELLSYKEYLQRNGLAPDAVNPNDPIYSGQYRLVPHDQYKKIKEYLEQKIAKEGLTRPDQVKRYQDTLDMLEEKLSDFQGNESIPLSKKEAETLAQLAKEGNFDPAEWHLLTEDLIEYKYVCQQALRAGMTAATISIVLKIAPEIIKAIQQLIEMGEVEEEQFRKMGFVALSGGAEGFLRGSISAAITTACKAGLWGEALKTADPNIIGTITVIAMDTIKNACDVAMGQKTRTQLADELVKEMYVSACSLLLGGVVQSLAPELAVVGFMIGSFVGSVLGSFTYSVGYQTAISFCVDTGFTMFNIVEQDYRLPEEIMEQIGLDVFDYDKFEPLEFEYRKFEAPKFQFNKMEPDSIEVVFLRRGVIGVRKVGYMS